MGFQILIFTKLSLFDLVFSFSFFVFFFFVYIFVGGERYKRGVKIHIYPYF